MPKMESLDLRDLRVLDTLIREGSITRTAQVLETTQPAISKLLRRLRLRFADPLVVRRGSGVQPTARAVEMAAQISALLDMADSLWRERMPFDPRKSLRTFSLLLTDVGMVRFLPPLVARLADLAPNVKVRALPLELPALCTEAGIGRGGPRACRLSEGRRPSALPAALFGRICQRDPARTSARHGGPYAQGLPRRAAYPDHRFRDGTCGSP